MQTKEFERHLGSFVRLLKKERTYLIKDDGENLTNLLSEKESFVKILEEYHGDVSEKARELIAKIKEQQEENLLLTQQAIGYQDMLMEAVKKNLSSPAGTYSKAAQVYAQPRTNFVDEEI
ncbi:flagella synthesis protein [Liquorilactobacillus hordei]|uniref:flagella synthesis protein n=1 Tax=Liquorilactobacillus hordei TaxID=468911 RepID=UPI001CC197A0|nr:flagella synthesis protein [Liquorilactobacillus hordei]MBZ2405924.1 flagella synthesis protein [Liquorilactobacillus hordei]